MKTLSFIGMLLGLLLVGMTLFTYLSMNEVIADSVLFMSWFLIGGIAGIYLLIFSLLVAKNYKWGKDDAFVPPPFTGTSNY